MRNFKISLLMLALSATIVGCTSTEQKATMAMDESLDGKFTSYDELQTYPGNVTCGKYLVADFMGGVEYRNFVVVNNEANKNPSPLDLAIYCSNEPLDSLNKSLSIDYLAQKAEIDAIVADMTSLEQPLLAYETDNRYFPWTDQGLIALVTPSTKGNPPRNFPEGGYISEVPKDPWGRDYDYRCDPFAGIRVMYKLQSLGRDGTKGGEGHDADIKVDYLQYFAHVNALL